MYDQDADVLYVSLGRPEYTDYVEVGDNLILRLDPETKQVVGFTVLDFVAQSRQRDMPLRLPLQATFERTRARRQARAAAEGKTPYRARTKSKQQANKKTAR